MKKLPLAFSGCLLGLAGAGNLILDIFSAFITHLKFVRLDFMVLFFGEPPQ